MLWPSDRGRTIAVAEQRRPPVVCECVSWEGKMVTKMYILVEADQPVQADPLSRYIYLMSILSKLCVIFFYRI